VTRDGTTKLAALPAGVTASLGTENDQVMGSDESQAGEYRFRVIHAYHSYSLFVRHKDSQDPLPISVGLPLIADPHQPFLFYLGVPDYRSSSEAIIGLDLRTQTERYVVLPTLGKTYLLAARRQQDGFLIAYVTPSDCVPDSSPLGALWFMPRKPNTEQRPDHQAVRLCFVKLPDEQRRGQ
jgi:hypothetical protein